MIYHEKSEFWDREFLLNTENDLRHITKIAYVKILLEQCCPKGFNVNLCIVPANKINKPVQQCG